MPKINKDLNRPDRSTDQPRIIPVIVDVPRPDPELGFERFVSAIAAAVVGGSPAQYTVGLYGPWGTGKSSILLSLKDALGSYDEVTVVEFDSWRHERAQNLLAPLIYAIREAMSQRGKNVQWGRILGGLEFQAFGFGIRVPSGSDRAAEATIAVKEYMESMEALTKIGSELAKGQRIVVLIDDLDRCSPDRVIEVLESIRLLMDVAGFVFVLAIDYEVLVDAVETKYKHMGKRVDAHRFIEKIVQVPFRIPTVDSAAGDFLGSLIPKWTQLRDDWFVGLTDEDIRSVAGLALRDNPRQIKRVLNSYMVARHIDWEGLATSKPKAQALLASLAMQLRWPNEFEELVSDIARYLRGPGSDLQQPVLGAVSCYREWLAPDFGGDSDERHDFVEFLKKHLNGSTSLRVVDAAMRAASKLSGPEKVGDKSPEEERAEFIDSVLTIVSSVGGEHSSTRKGAEAVVALGDRKILRIHELRSIPRTFRVEVRKDLAHPTLKSAVPGKPTGDWVGYAYAPTDSHSFEDLLDDARRLVEQVTSRS